MIEGDLRWGRPKEMALGEYDLTPELEAQMEALAPKQLVAA